MIKYVLNCSLKFNMLPR